MNIFRGWCGKWLPFNDQPGAHSGISLTFGDCCAYSSKWFLFSCSNKCLCRHYRRAFPKCEGEPKKGPTHNTQLCSQADRTYRNDKELGSITRPSSSSPM